ncbi:MAG: hypothetical protein N3G21_07500 [Candidatus Hydrogenedentes bacterium]|nr:hypothetical protein [Candidatus Hydrogenedentota bacterium]
MRIGINLTSTPNYEPDELVTRFFKKFLQYASNARGTTEFLVFVTENNKDLNFPTSEVIQIPLMENRLFSKLYIRSSPLDPLIQEKKVEVIISPLESASLISSIPCIPLVLHTENWFSGPQNILTFLNRESRRVLSNSPFWLTASEYGRKLCLEEWKVPLNKVIAVTVGAETALTKTSSSIIQQRYFVSAVDDSTIRHLPEIIDTLKNLLSSQPHTIVLIGKSHRKEPKEWGENILRVEKCPDNTLGGILHNSSAFIYPSLYDVSALRIIEALQAGTCVITPFNPAYEEKCGELPFYYQGGTISSFHSALNRVMSLPNDEKQERIRLGRLRVAEYSWQETAWKIITTLKKSI